MEGSATPTANATTATAGFDDHPVRGSVTVIGLGAMGATLARTLLQAGHQTTVWNRTARRADALVADGALRADDAAAAAAASPLVVVCLLDNGVVRRVLDPTGDALSGRTLANLTSSTPEDARDMAAWARGKGAHYLDGAIMVPTPMIGASDALMLYGGSRRAFDMHRGALEALGGATEYLGEDAGLAALYDVAMLDVFFAGMTAYLHAVALLGADGISAADFLPYGRAIVDVLQATLPGLSRDADGRSYPGDEDTIAMELVAVGHIVEASQSRGVDPALPELVTKLLRGAVKKGHGRDGFSRIVEELRRTPASD